MRFIASTLLLLMFASQLAAQSRTYAGGFSSRWKTVGPHGHDQPYCAEPVRIDYGNGVFGFHGVDCNPLDLNRANLDNSIGFRAGRERDFLSLRPLKLVGGIEGSSSFTEYNLTQMDFAFITGAVTAGADLTLWKARVGVRYGAGPFLTTDAQMGLHRFSEIVVSVPLRSGVALRLSQRQTNFSHKFESHSTGLEELGDGYGVSAVETSVLLAGTGDGAETPWEFATETGTSDPGTGGPGASLGLRATTYQRLAVFRDLGQSRRQAYVAWTSSAQESKLPGMYKGFPGNFRSKTVNGFGAGVREKRSLTNALSAHYGAGIEVADWRDDYGLLVRNSGTHVNGGIEGAIAVNGAIRWNAGRGTALELHAEQLYWTGIRLGEMRWGVALVLTR